MNLLANPARIFTMPKKILLIFYGVILTAGVLILAGFLNLPGGVLSQQQGVLEVSLLDVGQGDAILIRTPLQQKILIDGGPAANILTPLGQELGFFERQIDLLIITHPDQDHIAGLTEVLRRYKVKSVLLTGAQHDTVWYQDILRQIVQQNIPTIVANSQTDFDFGAGVILDVLWPEKYLAGKTLSEPNEGSVVIRLSYGKTVALLTGDLGLTGENELLRTAQNLQAQVLKLGHHGSDTASSQEFLNAVDSEIALVSAGKDNQYGHPKPEVLERLQGQEVFSTIELSTVRLESDGEEWEVLSTKY